MISLLKKAIKRFLQLARKLYRKERASKDKDNVQDFLFYFLGGWFFVHVTHGCKDIVSLKIVKSLKSFSFVPFPDNIQNNIFLFLQRESTITQADITNTSFRLRTHVFTYH